MSESIGPAMTAPAAPISLTVGDMLTDPTTLLSLTLVLVLLGAAYGFSLLAMDSRARKSTRFLFIWHVFDALIHFIFEGSFLYNCLFTYTTVTAPPQAPTAVPEVAQAAATSTKSFLNYIRILASSNTTAPSQAVEKIVEAVSSAPVQLAQNWLGHTDRLYGANFAPASNPFAALWRVYAQADFRWGVADANVVAIELLTVLIAGPLAVYVAYLLAKGRKSASVWMIVLATGEIYGGKFLQLRFSCEEVIMMLIHGVQAS